MGPSTESCVDLLRNLRTLFQLKHAMTMRVWPEEQGLHPAAIALLAELVHRGECRVSELAQHRVVDASVVSRQIAQLERAGLVERRPAPHDGRVALLSATDAGVELLDQWRRSQVEFMQEALGGWSDTDVRDLAARCGSFTEALRKALRPSPADAVCTTGGAR
ncbi:MarR family winged helix-turn-helix transcriptional regulator [Solihabitans fulvus]|nr:MarR family winged helix-turn-helix transcriptional regulator [Solihabitans fulvus]